MPGAAPPDRLHDEGRDVLGPELLYRGVEAGTVAHRTGCRGHAAALAAIAVRRRDPMDVDQPLTVVGLVVLPRRRGERQQRVAVIGGRERDHLVLRRLAGLNPVLAGQLQRGLDRLGAAAQEVELVQLRGKQRRQFVGERLHRLVGEGGAIDIGNLGGLVRHRLADFADPMAEVGDERPAGAVEVPVALGVDQPAPLATGDKRKAPGELPVEDMRIGILVGGHREGNLPNGRAKG